MSEKCEGMISELISQIEVSEEMTAMLKTSLNELIIRVLRDSVEGLVTRTSEWISKRC